MNTLQLYVSETVQAATEDDYEGDSLAACTDATRGTDTGWWNDLIYDGDVLDMFTTHLEAVRMWLDEMADGLDCPTIPQDEMLFHNLVRAAVEHYAWQYAQEKHPEHF